MCVSYRGGKSGCEGHLQVALQAQQSRNQDEDLCNVLKGIPVLGEREREKERRGDSDIRHVIVVDSLLLATG